ncbi:NADPH--hemoprotein reductase [Sarracenia purpurea var. burkii]
MKILIRVCDYFNIESTGDDVSIRQYKLTEHTDVDLDRVYTGEVARINSFKNQRPPFDAKNPFLSTVRVNKELHKSGDRSCMHIEFDIDGSKMRYDSGDHAAIYPENNTDLVNRLGELLNVNLDTIITLTNTDGKVE